MHTLLLIPSVLKTDIMGEVAADRHPRMDYHALAHALRGEPGGSADLAGYAEAENNGDRLTALARRVGGTDAALATHGCRLLRRGGYDAVFANGENVAIPLASLLRAGAAGRRRRPGLVTIAHRLSTGKKRPFLGPPLNLGRDIDAALVYAETQRAYAVQALGIPAPNCPRIAFHADTAFWRPQPEVPTDPHQICAAGLEWRDYPTLIEAIREMPGLEVRLAAASPWSKHTDETEGRTLPAHVSARRYDYAALRQLYAASQFVVVPLYENDFQAGVTSLLEAMAMGKAVILTGTTGQGADVVVDGENGLTVPPGDVNAWRRAIARLRGDADLRGRLGESARRWVLEHATLERWVGNVAGALRAAAAARAAAPPPRRPAAPTSKGTMPL